MNRPSKPRPNGKSRSPVQERSRQMVARILAAAEAELAERPVAEISCRTIARRAGVGVASLYDYFPDRESILRTVVQKFGAEELAALRWPLSMGTVKPNAAKNVRLIRPISEQVMRLAIDAARARPGLHRGVAGLSRVDPEVRRMLESNEVLTAELLAQALAGLGGELADEKVAKRMAVFCTWVGRVIAWGHLFDESPFGDEEIVALVSDLAERYLSSFARTRSR